MTPTITINLTPVQLIALTCIGYTTFGGATAQRAVEKEGRALGLSDAEIDYVVKALDVSDFAHQVFDLKFRRETRTLKSVTKLDPPVTGFVRK